MEEEANKRKARLAALRTSHQKLTTQRPSTQPTAPSEPIETIETDTKDLITEALSEKQAAAEETDISAIAPKRANWDLKRDLQKQLDKLKPTNDLAVANLIRRRVQQSDDGVDLAAAVEAHAKSALNV